MLDFTQCDWIDLTKLTRYHQNLMSFLSENYLNKSGGTMNGQINSCSILPKTTDTYDLGSSGMFWNYVYTVDVISKSGVIRPNSTGTGKLGSSSYYWGNAYINNITSGTIVPKTDNTYDLGSSTYKFKDAYINNLHGTADEVAATALSIPTGAILRLSAKGCTTASIANDNGVIDVSGNGNHGRAYGGVAVSNVDYFYSNGDTGNKIVNNLTDNHNSWTLVCKAKHVGTTKGNGEVIFGLLESNISSLNIKGELAFRGNKIVGEFYNSNEVALSYSTDINEEHHYALTYDSNNEIGILYVDGIEVARKNVTLSQRTSKYFYAIGWPNATGYELSGYLSDVRIYPYALSATQVKSLYMFPDEALFAQLTADLIGTNVVNAKNLVKTEAVITETAQISQAIVKDLVVTNGVTIGDLNTTANQANTTATSANTKIDNLQVGGRNLLLNSNNGGNGWNNASYPTFSLRFGELKPNHDDYVTLTMQTGGIDWNVVSYMQIYNSGGSVATGLSFASAAYDENTKIIKATGKWIVGSASNTFANLYVIIKSGQTRPAIQIDWVKLEFGNKSTTWTPAPEDTDSLIATAQGKADSAYSNNQATQTQLDNLQVGGRNLARYTSKTITQDNYSNEKRYDFSNYAIKILKNLPITITISTHVKGTNLVLSGDARLGVLMMLNVTQNGTQKNVWIGKLKKLPINTATTFDEWLVSNTTIDVTTIHSFIYISADVATYVSGTFSITETKVEVGNQATTWTPAPEDVDADISTAQTTANTAVSNAATAQSGVNTLNEIVMPNGEILSYNADNYLDNTSYFKDEVQKFDNANLAANTFLNLFGYDDEVGRFVKIRQNATNNTYIRFLCDYSSNAGLSNAINSSMLTGGYSLWLKCKIYDSAVSEDSETHGGLFTLKSYGMMGIGIRKQTKSFTLNPYGTNQDTSIAIDFEKWIDVCLTVEGSNTETKKAKLYVNGTLKAERTWSETQRTGFDVIYLTQGGGGYNSTHISMDVKAIKVFLRPLTAGEVAGLTKYFNTTGSATAKNINNAQTTANIAQTTIENQVGQINLISKYIWVNASLTNGKLQYNYQYRISTVENIVVKPSTTYAFKFSKIDNYMGVRMGVHCFDSQGNFLRDLGWMQMTNITKTITFAADTTGIKIVVSFSSSSTNVTTDGTESTTKIDISKIGMSILFKMEEGEKATVWTPNPNDSANAQNTANTAVTNLNNINLMTTASVDALFNLTSAANA